MSLRTDVRGLEAAWNAVEDEMDDDMSGPTLDYGDGHWTASVWPPVNPDGEAPDPIESTRPTPVAALEAVAEQLRGASA